MTTTTLVLGDFEIALIENALRAVAAACAGDAMRLRGAAPDGIRSQAKLREAFLESAQQYEDLADRINQADRIVVEQ